MTRLKTIEILVAEKMRDCEEFRLHKNREKLLLTLRAENPGKRLSASSVERVQRKVWSRGFCLPDKVSNREEWHKTRRELSEEFVVYAIES